jgi:nuclease S1
MRRADTRLLLLLAVCGVAMLPSVASAFGPLGHRVAGLLAERGLCGAARAEIEALAGGESLADLGVWADSARSLPEWRVSAPWHYMNIDAATPEVAAALAAIEAFRTPPEGDVLSAIARFRSDLADRSLPERVRSTALKFLVHFVIDVHQPLHVGLAADRGGNTVDVRYGASVVNLHRFWDTDVLDLRMLEPARYARRLRRRFESSASSSRSPPEVWAAESLALRGTVYAFASEVDIGAGAHALSSAYISTAQAVIDERLALGAARLAATLNAMFCD